MPRTIEIQNLTRAFGELIAVDAVNLSIGAGELFGLVGSNGAARRL